jgi:hypothetical protein
VFVFVDVDMNGYILVSDTIALHCIVIE